MFKIFGSHYAYALPYLEFYARTVNSKSNNRYRHIHQAGKRPWVNLKHNVAVHTTNTAPEITKMYIRIVCCAHYVYIVYTDGNDYLIVENEIKRANKFT